MTACTIAPTLLRRERLPRSSCGLSLRRDCNNDPWEISWALA